jgi:hypothetical protein
VTNSRLRRWLPIGAVVLATALAQPITNAVAGSEKADPNAAVATVQAGTAQASPAGLVNASDHATSPTAAQIGAAEAAAAKRPFAGPRKAAVPAAALPQPESSATRVASDPSPAAEPTGLSVFRNTQIPSSGLSGGYANVSPTTGEPSTDINGKNVFQTGNWYATYSKDGGGTWTSLNPFTIFGSGFCCDQVAIYDSARDRWFWLLQYGDHLTVANSAGGSLTSWCSYTFNPQAIGAPSGAVYDYNDIALGTRFLYVTSNIFGSTNSSAVLRLPLSEMITCSGFSYNFIRRSTEFTYKAATGSGDTALIASNTLDSGTGTTLRIFSWPESSTSLSIFNRAIPAFTYYTRNSGQNCSSADAVVNNWCQFADSRVLGGAKGGNLVAWSWNAKQSGTARPKPYTRLTVLDARSLTVLASNDVFSTANAFQFMSIGADDRGHIGMVVTEGGGVGSTHKYPSPDVFIRDDVNPAPGFSGVTVATGFGGGCASTGGVIRWGDYQTSRAVETADGVFIGAGIRKIGTSCTGANNPPRNFVYGRARSLPGYNRWRLV